MLRRYRLTAPIPAIHYAPTGAEIADLCVKLPADAVLVESVVLSSIFGMVDVYWEKRHYSIHRSDLFKRAELVSAA
jgi:hypothetical protein